MNAVNRLKPLGPSHVTTENIIFICEQDPTGFPSFERDEIVDQSESNLKAYADLFQQQEEGVTHGG